jgi:hypothetical protein
MEEHGELELLPDETLNGKAVTVIRVIPKGATLSDGYVNYFMAQDSGLIVKMIATEPSSGTTTHAGLTEIRLNVDIPSERFVFHAPPGVVQSARQPEADSVRLTREATAVHAHGHVEEALDSREFERLGDSDLVRGTREVVVELTPVDAPRSLARRQVHACNRALATPYGLDLGVLCHISRQTSNGSGRWPWWGCAPSA